MSRVTSIGLYYPYVHARDPRWLKTAALYWSRMGRVVAPDFPLDDPPEVRALRGELDFVIDVDPTAAARAVAPMFLRLLREHEDPLRAAYPAHPDRGMEFGRASVGQFPAAPGALPPLAGLHWNEVDAELREALFATGLAGPGERLSPSGDDPVWWVALDPSLAWAYKCALTQELAGRTGYLPSTDQVAAHTDAGHWSAERLSDFLLGRSEGAAPPPAPAEDLGSVIALMAVECVIPSDLDNVPIEKIVKLRTGYRSEFHAFSEAVGSAAETVRSTIDGDVTDPEALGHHLAVTLDRQFTAPLEDLRKAMRGLRLKTATGTINHKFEAGLLIPALGGLAGQPAVTAGAVALGIATLRQAAAEIRDDRMANSPVSYLLRLERDLKSASPARRLARGLGRATGTGI